MLPLNAIEVISHLEQFYELLPTLPALTVAYYSLILGCRQTCGQPAASQ